MWTLPRSLALVALLFAGCGGSSIRSERQELQYLNSLANPTTEQLIRRKHMADVLGTRDAYERSEREDRVAK